jgi:uncharacterized protein
MQRLIRIVLGWFAIGLGVAGLVLPLLQGWLFIGIGAVLLSPDVPLFGRLVCWVENRFPRLRGTVYRMRLKLFRYGDAPPPAVQKKRDCRLNRG